MAAASEEPEPTTEVPPKAPSTTGGRASPASASRTPRQRTAAALLSTVGMVLCCPDYDLWWLGMVAWVPYLWAIEGCTPRQAMRYGWLTGTLTVLWGFFWMTNLLTKFAMLPMPVAFIVASIFSAWHGLIWGLSAYVIAWMRQRGASLLVVAPMAWVVMEAALPNLFPIYMALGWCWQPLWIQTAELGGVTMVSGTMVALNAALYRTLATWLDERRFDRRSAAIALAWIVGIPSYGAIRIAQVEAQMEAAPTLGIAAIQGNFSIFQMRRKEEKQPILRRQQALTARFQAQGAELAVWGETAYPYGRQFFRDSTTDLPPGNPRKIQQEFTIPVVVGTVTTPRGPDGRPLIGNGNYPYNTALLIDGQGRIAGMYDKVYRLAFGEYFPIPFLVEWYLSQIPNAAHIAQGKGPDVLTVETQSGTWRLGPFICYEDILPRFVRQAAGEGVHVFVNLTNDAWFGKTHEPSQHLGLAVFRTVEHRKGMVRAVNTGISTYIDPTGRAVAKTEVTDPDVEGPQEADGVLAMVPMMDPDARTLYGLTGELFNVLMGLGLLVIGWRRRGLAPPTEALAEALAKPLAETPSETPAEALAEIPAEAAAEPKTDAND
ncbi:apolipoprotein N-acyltransferase [Paraliomyxa miuraensis]|uniref:apolipoprotein N-acyltransferase n=1 Tax=Paraliomyxa miuraensis TaxID=376150 RepID=UPI00224D56B7|nr:apolipoprotein N-acyltransferase [Paraliomyxa miuraensis]MCX4245958.1 apolipoprotein N-acyltransferase [Paraliomyxa miuraensis]